MKNKNKHLAMSRMGLNMYNPLQAKRSWGYRKTPTLLELRSSSICYHLNHANQINHSSDKRGRKDEGTKGRKEQTLFVIAGLTRNPLSLDALDAKHRVSTIQGSNKQNLRRRFISIESMQNILIFLRRRFIIQEKRFIQSQCETSTRFWSLWGHFSIDMYSLREKCENTKGRKDEGTNGRKDEGMKGRKDEGTKGRKENNACLFTHSLVYSFTDNTTLSSLRGTKQSRIMKHKMAYYDKGWKAIQAGVLDCFATLAMTNQQEGRRDERANGRKENNAYLFTRSLVYSFTDNTPLSSLRGTKQSRTMKHKKAYNDKGWKPIREGILDCFATLAMTNQREGMTKKSLNNNAWSEEGRMDERAKGRKEQATSISSWLACLLLVACSLLRSSWLACLLLVACCLLRSSWLACLLLVACSLLRSSWLACLLPVACSLLPLSSWLCYLVPCTLYLVPFIIAKLKQIYKYN